jgi:curli biogenesis system outer membrane secretion channel CsgG
MRKSILFILTLEILILLLFNFATAQVIKPKARGTPSSGPAIDEAQKEDYMGPKARVAVTRFEDKSAKGSSEIGSGMAEMLGNALFSTNRYIVLERQALDDVLYEQDLGASGRVRQETAARIGEIEGADLLILGTITEFEPGTAGAGGEKEISFPLPGRIKREIGDVLGSTKIGGGFKKAHLALIVKVVDARTGRRLASEQVEGTATDIEGMTGLAGGVLSGVFSGYSKTPMEKAIRIAINESVRIIVSKTPTEYYRVPAPSEPQATSGPTPPVPPRPGIATPTSPSSQPSVAAPASGGEPRIVYVKWPQVGLREGPGTTFKTTIQVQKGTPLAVLEEMGHWYRVRLEDGQEGWIGKATTSDIP